MTTPQKYKDAELNLEYVGHLERTLEEVKRGLHALEDIDCEAIRDGVTDILEILS